MNLYIVYTEPGLDEKLPPTFRKWSGYNKAPFNLVLKGIFSKEGLSEYNYRYILQNTIEDTEPYWAIIIVPEIYGNYFGECKEWDYDNSSEVRSVRPLILLSANKIYKYSRWFSKIFGGWVLQHELGHALGLEEHFNPLCVMSKPNISFGRFCKSCKRKMSNVSRSR